jgi:hypothetical protein
VVGAPARVVAQQPPQLQVVPGRLQAAHRSGHAPQGQPLCVLSDPARQCCTCMGRGSQGGRRVQGAHATYAARCVPASRATTKAGPLRAEAPAQGPRAAGRRSGPRLVYAAQPERRRLRALHARSNLRHNLQLRKIVRRAGRRGCQHGRVPRLIGRGVRRPAQPDSRVTLVGQAAGKLQQPPAGAAASGRQRRVWPGQCSGPGACGRLAPP